MAIRRIVILGGGVAGWMCALGLGRALAGAGVAIELVETSGPDHSIGPFGPAEATLPAFHAFLAAAGVDEDALLHAARGSFALGSAFSGWGGADASWFLPFGEIGAPLGSVPFPQLVARLRGAGETLRLADYSLAAVAAASGRFARPSADPRSVLSSYGYGLHLDKAGLAATLRGLAKGVTHHQPRFARALRSEGTVTALELESGQHIPGDLFLDCTGAAARLCHDHGFESWSAWLPCDRAIESATSAEGVPPPYAHAGAHDAGWRRTIPLAGGQGEALIYASAHLADAHAAGFGPEPAVAIAQGRRSQAWQGNVIAIGAAAALVEPLHGHNLQMVHTAIQRLIALFPNNIHGAEAAEYNRLTASEADRVRDFAILHYKTNARIGQAFWDACRAMTVPEPLQYKLDLYASRGRMPIYDDELFDRPEWIAALDGQGVRPRRHDALADAIPEAQLHQHLARLREVILAAAKAMPGHGAALRQLGLAA